MEFDLTCYYSVFSKLGIEVTPAGNLVILEGTRILVPRGERKRILGILHEFHSTKDQMFRIAKGTLYWPTMKQDIFNIFERCSIYQANRRAKLPSPHPLSSFC